MIKKQFKSALQKYLMTHCFCSLDEFQNNRENDYKLEFLIPVLTYNLHLLYFMKFVALGKLFLKLFYDWCDFVEMYSTVVFDCCVVYIVIVMCFCIVYCDFKMTCLICSSLVTDSGSMKWVNEWMNEWMNEYVCVCFFLLHGPLLGIILHALLFTNTMRRNSYADYYVLWS
jgi:hypothetical protein